MLQNLLGNTPTVNDSTEWYSSSTDWAIEVGLFSADGSQPEEEISREQLIVIMYNMAKLTGKDTKQTTKLTHFGDSSEVSEWASEAMEWAVGSGIMGGKGENLDPKGTSTIAEMSVIMNRFLQ